MQRTNILTYQHRIDLREERINSIQSEIRLKQLDKLAALNVKAEANKDNDIIFSQSKNNKAILENINLLQRESFTKGRCEELKLFILAQKTISANHTY